MLNKTNVRRACGYALLFAAVTLPCNISAHAETSSFPQPEGALAESLDALSSAWNTSPLAFTAANFAEAPATGYGAYTARSSNAFNSGDALIVYAEPVGYGFKSSADAFEYSLSASYRLLNTTGQVLAEGNDFAQFSGTAHSMKRELPASLSFNFGGLPIGNYKLEVMFKDEVGGKSGTISLPFSIGTQK